MRTIDIGAVDLETVRGILSRFIPDREVRAFGSRVSGRAKEFSDLDLVVMGEDSIPSEIMADMKEAFRESNLPFKVDVVESASVKTGFRRIIEKDNVTIQEKR